MEKKWNLKKCRILSAMLAFLLSISVVTGCSQSGYGAGIGSLCGGYGSQNTPSTGTSINTPGGAQGGSSGSIQEEEELLEVHFLDIGQGDSTLVKCGGQAMLIDAGVDGVGTQIQNYLTKQGVEKLDYLILTHPDSDHIGSAAVVVNKFEIDKVFMSDYEKDNKTYRNLIRALDQKNLKWETPAVGSVYTLGSAQFTILGPVKKYEDPNNASIALLLKNGENTFLFTGDAEEEAEDDIVEAAKAHNIDLKTDVYKAGHHGSRTSSSMPLLDAAEPASAVISCGEGNSYGHPHAQTLNSFRMRGILVYRTDEQGTIVAKADGKAIIWNTAPSDTWQAGEPTGSSKKNSTSTEQPKTVYILNTKSMKFHRTTCKSLPTANREETTKSREELIKEGYEPCGRCKP